MADTRRLDELKSRVQQDPASIAFAALADEYRRMGQFHDAIETCRAGLLRHPAYVSARVTLGRALLEIGEYDDAQEQLEQVIRVAPDNLAAIRALADIHHKRGDSPEAYAAHAQTLAAAIEAVPAPAPEPVAPAATPKRVPVASAPALQVESHMVQTEPVAPVPVPETPALVAVSTEAAAAPAAYVPAVDPVCERLEQFLAAIERARVAADPALVHSGR